MEPIEIERKFLVVSNAYRHLAQSQTKVAQGFLNTHPERTVRVRTMGGKGYLTIKGKSNESGTSRFEWEHVIAVSEAIKLLDLCEGYILEKIRYRVPFGNHIFEVDEFLGDNRGLVVAEVELQQEDETFEKPNWLGKEVTGQVPYYNSQLVLKPFGQWRDDS